MKSIHQAAVRKITEGLVELGILEGDVRELIKIGAYKEFYPHGTGHLVGLDVHDIPSLNYKKAFSPKLNCELEAGQIITVEPGYTSILKTKKFHHDLEE